MRALRGGLMTAFAVIVAAGFLFTNATAALMPNSAVTKTRIYNDCPFSTPTVVNNYPASIVLRDDCPDCGPFGFANLHNWTYSTDAVDGMVVNNNDGFKFGAWVTISGTTNGEAGMRFSPWFSQDVDGRFNIRVPDGEIACFGGRLPFYSFTFNQGITYTRGLPIYLEITYLPNDLNAGNPGTIEYVVGWGGNTYTSGPLPFDQGTAAEDPPYGLWGCLNSARAGGYFQPFINHAGPTALDLQAEFTDVAFQGFPAVTPVPNSAVAKTRIYNDCPFSTPTVVNNYPASIVLRDDCPDCGPFGFANLHNWTYSTDGSTGMVLNNNMEFRFGSWVTISGTTNGEAGMRFSPWFSQDVDGRFNIRVPDGEIACFGGRLPFYSFTGHFGITYTRGMPIYLEMVYHPNGMSSTLPATLEYIVGWMGNTYTSGPLPFDQGTASEDPPHGLWGCLNDARAGGYFQPFINHAGPPALNLQAEFRGTFFTNDFTPPEVTCTVYKMPKVKKGPDVGDEDSGGSGGKGRFRKDFYIIDYAATDMNPVTVNAYIDVGCKQIPVSDGDIVKVKCRDDGKSGGKVDPLCPVTVKVKKDYLEISHAMNAVLVVVATDAYGNTSTCTSPICRMSVLKGLPRNPQVAEVPVTAALTPLSSPRDRVQTVEFRLPEGAEATLDVFDVTGRRVQRVVESYQSEGLHRVDWDTSGVPNGIYFYQLRAGNVLKSQKVAVIH